MWLYSVIMLLVGGILTALSVSIYKGKTNLIHEYHQSKVSNRSAYGRAFGKAMLVVAMTVLLSGIISLLGDSETIAMIAISQLFIGLIIGIACIVVVQKKYNNGVF